MKVLEEVYFEVPTSDVERKDFKSCFLMAVITAAIITIVIIITI